MGDVVVVVLEMEAGVSSKLKLMKEIYTIYRKIIEAANHQSKDNSPIWQEFQEYYHLDTQVSVRLKYCHSWLHGCMRGRWHYTMHQFHIPK